MGGELDWRQAMTALGKRSDEAAFERWRRTELGIEDGEDSREAASWAASRSAADKRRRRPLEWTVVAQLALFALTAGYVFWTLCEGLANWIAGGMGR